MIYVLIIVLGMTHTHSIEFTGSRNCEKAKTELTLAHRAKGYSAITAICVRQ